MTLPANPVNQRRVDDGNQWLTAAGQNAPYKTGKAVNLLPEIFAITRIHMLIRKRIGIGSLSDTLASRRSSTP